MTVSRSIMLLQMAVSIFFVAEYHTTLMAESEEELRSLLVKVKVEREKVGLKLNIQKTKIMASGNSVRLYFFVRAPKSLQMVIAAMKLKDTYSLEGKL